MEGEHCPQCGTLFQTFISFRKMGESCGHVMCRHCVMSEEGCNQCKLNNELNVDDFLEVELTEYPIPFKLALPEMDLSNSNLYPQESSLDHLKMSRSIPEDSQFHFQGSQCEGSEEPGWDRVTTPSRTPEILTIPKKTNKGRPSISIPSFITTLQKYPPLYQCSICQRKFTSKTSIWFHRYCEKGDRPYKCNYEQCGKEFVYKSHYECHRRTHDAGARIEKPKLLDCTQCKKSFGKMKDFKRHLMIHTDVRPFECLICGTAYKLKFGLIRHIQNKHRQSKLVAEKLANDGGLKYLMETSNSSDPLLPNFIPPFRIESFVLSTALKNSNLFLPDPDRVISDCTNVPSRSQQTVSSDAICNPNPSSTSTEMNSFTATPNPISNSFLSSIPPFSSSISSEATNSATETVGVVDQHMQTTRRSASAFYTRYIIVRSSSACSVFRSNPSAPEATLMYSFPYQ